MRLERERPPDPADRALAHPGRSCHRTRRPMRRVGRLLFERLHDHPLDGLITNQTRLPRPRLVMQPVETAAGKPAPPLADRVVITTKLGRDLLARPALRGRQHDPATKRQSLRTLRPPSPPLKRLPLLIVKHNLSTRWHNRPHRRG